MKDYTYRAALVRVIDGDSIECAIDLGFSMTARLPVRLAHINAVELNQIGGKQAKDHLIDLLGANELLLRTYKPKDKYGRYLAEVMVGEMNVNMQMIEDGYAVAYEGGRR